VHYKHSVPNLAYTNWREKIFSLASLAIHYFVPPIVELGAAPVDSWHI